MRPQSLLFSFATLALVTQFTFAQDAAKTIPAVKIVPAAGVDAPPRAAPVTTLKLGDAAPAFQVDSWVKGDSFTSLEKGNVYVMEFWATWCGPCITAMPHLSALQKQYPDVRFVGVAASESGKDQVANLAKVTAFVEQKGDGMGYRVVFAGDQTKMNAPWMRAAGQSGIPCSFIVDAKGRVAWIGHPMSMDKPLEEIVAGTWDIAAALKVQEAALAVRAFTIKLRSAQMEAKTSGDWTTVLGMLDEMIASDPTSASARIAAMKILAGPGKNPEKAWKLGREALVLAKDEPQLLNQIAWTICASDTFETRDMQLALAAAELTVAGSKGEPNPAYLDTCARCLWMSGKKDAAIAMQREAAKLSKDTPMGEGINEVLAQYESGETPKAEVVP